jgi:DNA anti-recombination protein RmuC
MTIDERLEKLTERHEALAQAMELNASLQRDHDQRTGRAIEALNQAVGTINQAVGTLNQAVGALNQGVETLASLHADNERRMGGMMEAITRLGNIVADHDIRLDNLEGRA